MKSWKPCSAAASRQVKRNKFRVPNACLPREVLPCSAALVLLVAASVAHSQSLQQWRQKSLAGDTTTAGESSAAVAMDANYMFVADNEHETLRTGRTVNSTGAVNPFTDAAATNGTRFYRARY